MPPGSSPKRHSMARSSAASTSRRFARAVRYSLWHAARVFNEIVGLDGTW
jgi:hypothetical protein